MPSEPSVTVSARAVAIILTVTGLAHLVVPGLLVRVASSCYRRVLGIRFEPTARTARRVRLVGLCMLAAGVLARRLGTEPP